MSLHGTSAPSVWQKRFSTIRLPSFLCRRWKPSSSRGSMAETRPMGMVTRPKLIEPFHVIRIAIAHPEAKRVPARRRRGHGTLGAGPEAVAQGFLATRSHMQDEEATMAEGLQELVIRQVARFSERMADWDAFADARVEGYRRAQHRYIGSGASGKVDQSVIPAEHFTLSVMFIPPGQGNAAHTHEVEEVFFILRGKVM